MEQLKALVIDDSAEVREFVIEYVLEPNGFAVEVAKNGAEGLKKTLKAGPDVILMDYEMPKLTGLELLRLLRNVHMNKTPVILMTSHGSEQIAVEFFRLGVHDYIIKPFHPQDMLKAIDNALSVTRLQREKEALTQRVMEANRQLTQRLEELNALSDVGKTITALVQPNKLFERIVDVVLTVTGGEECTLALTDPVTGETKPYLSKQRMSRQGVAKPEYPPGSIALKPAGRSAAEAVTNMLLSVPMQVGTKRLGSLSISSNGTETSSLTNHDQQLLRMLADYAAIAIQNMRLVRQIQLTKEREKEQIRGLFERYVASSVVKQALSSPGKVSLGGTRQTLTILFADVRGFSTLSSQISPEVLIELLNQYMRVAADAILTQEGTLDKFMGDAVMAFFNAPLFQADHPVRAVRAAWILQQAVKRLHKQLPLDYRLDFGVGVGTGDAVVGNIGAPQLMNYTVIGDAVNRVKRLQENARGGQILVSQVTYLMVQDYVQVRSLGQVHLKGQPYPEVVYEVIKVD